MNTPPPPSQSASSIATDINENGFATIKNFFSLNELAAFEECVVDLFLLQAQKIGEYRNEALRLQGSDLPNFEKFSSIKVYRADRSTTWQ